MFVLRKGARQLPHLGQVRYFGRMAEEGTSRRAGNANWSAGTRDDQENVFHYSDILNCVKVKLVIPSLSVAIFLPGNWSAFYGGTCLACDGRVGGRKERTRKLQSKAHLLKLF